MRQTHQWRAASVAALALVTLCLPSTNVGRLFVPQVIPTLVGTLSRPISTTTTLYTTRMNAGGPEYVDGAGRVWLADTSGANNYTVPDAIANTTDDTLYQSEAYAQNLSYYFTVPNGTYTVTFKFAEIYFSSAARRVFDIRINGAAVRTGYDIFAAAGGNYTAKDESFPNITVSGGGLAIELAATVDNGKLSAIEIVQTAAAPGGSEDPPPAGTYLRTFMPGGVCPAAGVDVSSSIQTAVNSVPNGGTLVWDCVNAGMAGNVLINGRTDFTINATTGAGPQFIGSPAQYQHQLKVTNCTRCAVKNLTIDGNQRQSYGFVSIANTDFVFQGNTIKNLSPYAGAAFLGRGGVRTKILDNTLQNLSPIFVSGSTNRIQDVNCRGFWMGEGGDPEYSPEIARNRAYNTGHTYIVLSGTNGWIHDNYGEGLVYEGIKVSSDRDYAGFGTTVIENNEFHGTLAGWKLFDNVTPVNGGHFQFGMGGSSTGKESWVLRYNTFDGGAQGLGIVGKVGNVDAHHNKFINQWDTGALMTQNSSLGTIRIHHNYFGTTRAGVRDTPYPIAIQIHADTGTAISLSNITVDNNWISSAWWYGVHLRNRSNGSSISNINVNSNSFGGNGGDAVFIELGGGISAGTISGISVSSNCYTGNGFRFGGGSIFDGRGILSSPSQAGSCSNPSGVTP